MQARLNVTAKSIIPLLSGSSLLLHCCFISHCMKRVCRFVPQPTVSADRLIECIDLHRQIVHNGRQRLPSIREPLAGLDLLVHKVLIDVRNQGLVLVVEQDLHPQRMVYQDRPLTLRLHLRAVLHD